MPCHSETGQSKSLFLLIVAMICFQAKKFPFSHGNGHGDWRVHCEFFVSRPFPGSLSVIWNNYHLPLSVSFRQVWAKLCFRKHAIKMLLSNERPIIALGL